MEDRLAKILGPLPLDLDEISRRYDTVVAQYARDVQSGLADERDRIIEQGWWIQTAGSVVDLGGGLGPFPPLAAALGLRSVVCDLFAPDLHLDIDELRALVEKLGVEFITGDVIDRPLPFETDSIDAVTSFESIEHWHHSPRRLFKEVMRILRPGGLVIISAPNAVNIRKRLAVPLGRTNWSRFEDWYEPDFFHGHVREPTAGDMGRLALAMGLESWTVVGRNWLGLHRVGWQRAVGRLLDRPLRLRPSLCSNLYLVGRAPTAGRA